MEIFGEAMPDIPPTERLHETWQDLGKASAGPAPFSWSEVKAFADLSGADLHPVEARCLIEMSRAFVEAVADTNPLSIAPMERKHD